MARKKNPTIGDAIVDARDADISVMQEVRLLAAIPNPTEADCKALIRATWHARKMHGRWADAVMVWMESR